jgi:hypothetical protein
MSIQNNNALAQTPKKIAITILALIVVWRIFLLLLKWWSFAGSSAPSMAPIYQPFMAAALIDQMAIALAMLLALFFRNAEAVIVAFAAVLFKDVVSIGRLLSSGADAYLSTIDTVLLVVNVAIALIGLVYAIRWLKVARM